MRRRTSKYWPSMISVDRLWSRRLQPDVKVLSLTRADKGSSDSSSLWLFRIR